MRIYFTVLLLCLCFPGLGQDAASLARLKEERLQRKEMAIKSIAELKGGVLLVRLDFQQGKIDYFDKYENYKEVARIEKEAKKENAQIIDAFKTYYTFSKVYYFAMADSRKLLEGQLDSMTFYNALGEPDAAIRIPDSNYLIAEFGYIEQDTAVYYSGSTPRTDDPDNPEGKSYYGGSKNLKPALVIRGRDFSQLRDPFPYYVGYNAFGSVKKRYRLPVKRLNELLENYARKATQ